MISVRTLTFRVLRSDWVHTPENAAVLWLISDWVFHKSDIGIKGETSFYWNKWLETAVNYGQGVNIGCCLKMVTHKLICVK